LLSIDFSEFVGLFFFNLDFFKNDVFLLFALMTADYIVPFPDFFDQIAIINRIFILELPVIFLLADEKVVET